MLFRLRNTESTINHTAEQSEAGGGRNRSMQCKHSKRLELLEELDALALLRVHRQNVETNSLRQRTALANDDLVTLEDTEGGRGVRRDVAVTLLETVVFRDVVQVVTANDDGALHLRAVNNALEDTAADGDVAGERTLLVDVFALNGLLRRLEAQTNVLVPSCGTLLGAGTLR